MRIIGILASPDEVWDAIVEHAEADGGCFNQPSKTDDFEVHNNTDPDGVTEIVIYDERWYDELDAILSANFTLVP